MTLRFTGIRPDAIRKRSREIFAEEAKEVFRLRDEALKRGWTYEQVLEALRETGSGGATGPEFIKRFEEVLAEEPKGGGR